MLEPGDHGSTFAGGPVATAAALAVLDIVDDPALLRQRARAGRLPLREARARSTASREIRGRGLMLGVGLEEGIDAAAVGADLLERGLVVNVPRPDTLRLLPPLVIDSDHVDTRLA